MTVGSSLHSSGNYLVTLCGVLGPLHHFRNTTPLLALRESQTCAIKLPEQATCHQSNWGKYCLDLLRSVVAAEKYFSQ